MPNPFQLSYEDKYNYPVINNKVQIGSDCSSSMRFYRHGVDRFVVGYEGICLELSDLIRELDCVIVEVEYEDANSGSTTWKMPSLVVLEKDGYQLRIKKTNDRRERVKIDFLKLKHNKKAKNASNLLYGPPVLVENENLE